jgi:eukaryotic-like serine/threonine-protein kinase
LIGETISHYRVLEQIGAGGMGVVYRAHDQRLERDVALKVLPAGALTDEAARRRFRKEALALSKVSHPNIATVFDFDTQDGTDFLVEELIPGLSLSEMLIPGPLPERQIVNLGAQLADGLAAAHEQGVIHRDLKPANIRVTPDALVKILDFGLAKVLRSAGSGVGEDATASMTETQTVSGTLPYMSPEQLLNEKLDARSDIWATGCVLYEMATGRRPFLGSGAPLINSILNQALEPPAKLNSKVQLGLEAIIVKCLEKDPAWRYASAREIAIDLRRVGTGTVTRALAARRRTAVWKLSIAAAVLLLAFVGVGGWLSHRSRPARPEVRHTSISILVADFANNTGDPVFDGTLEPMLNVALESASFVTTYNRGEARRLAGNLPTPTNKLDENAARLVAVNQGIAVITTGSLSSHGTGYRFSVNAIDAVTGKALATADVTAADKDEVLLDIPKLAAPIRKALGDTTPESVQVAAVQGSLSTSNLEAVHQYGIAMEQQWAGKLQDALQSFSKAAELDPNFARAYAGMAATSRGLGKTQDADKYIRLALTHVDRMSERERYRIRGLYYLYSGDFPKCIEEYTALVKLYPSDNLGHANLAACYNELHNYPKALEEMQSALQITPTSVVYRFNISLLSTYTGNFQTAEQQAWTALQSNPSSEYAYNFLAYAQVGQGQLAQAVQSYQTLGKLSPLGASISASGLADLALYEGRFSDAARILASGAATDLATKNSRAAEKFAVLAHTQLLLGHRGPALEAAKRALLTTQKVNVRFLVAQVFVEAGETERARALAAGLGSELSLEAQADSKLIEGEIALQDKDTRKAIQLFTEANKMLATWMGWFDLGRAYLEAGLYVQADSEFDLCVKERGLAMELLDGPTYGYFPPAYYYLGRAEQGLGSPGAADSYRKFVSIQNKGDGGALFEDAKKRLTALTPKR